jgi:hypothetical protein
MWFSSVVLWLGVARMERSEMRDVVASDSRIALRSIRATGYAFDRERHVIRCAFALSLIGMCLTAAPAAAQSPLLKRNNDAGITVPGRLEHPARHYGRPARPPRGARNVRRAREPAKE